MVGSHRIERLNKMFLREVARLLLTGIKDPRVLGVAVTEVRVTRDLSYATVFVRLDGSQDPEGAMAGLTQASGFMRRELGRSVRLRKMPELRFEADETLEHASRIEELLRQVRESDGQGEA